MKKKKLTILSLLMALLMVLSLSIFVACNNGDGSTTTTESEKQAPMTEGLIIPNSDFNSVSVATSSYPRSIVEWNGAKMYSSGSFSDDVIAGAVSLDKTLYDKNKANWGDKNDSIYNLLNADGRFDGKTPGNALMIYMPTKGTEIGDEDAKYEPTAYGYNAPSYTLDANKYYKLSIDVLTHNIAGVEDENGVTKNNPGARIFLSSSTYAEFDEINTNSLWETFEIYIESSKVAETSLSLQLALGKYSSNYSKGLTTGYVFFDNITLSEVEDTTADTASDIYADKKTAELADNSNLATASLLVQNNRFDFGSTSISSSSAPSGWTAKTGNSSETDPAPTSLGYNGIIDTAKFDENFEDYSGTYYAKSGDKVTPYTPSSKLDSIKDVINNYNRVGSNVYMISQQLMTAQSIKSSKNITIQKNTAYCLSIDVMAFDIRGEGVSLVLKAQQGKDIIIKGIAQNRVADIYTGTTETEASRLDTWTTFNFYILGNEFKDYNYSIELWLGTGGKNDNTSVDYKRYTSTSSNGIDSVTYDAKGTFSTGWAFFDEINLTQIADTEYDSVGGNTDFEVDASSGTAKHAKVSLSTPNIFPSTISADFSTASSDGLGFDAETLGTPSGFGATYDTTDSTLAHIDPSFVTAGVVEIGENANTDFAKFGTENPGVPYDIAVKKALMIASSQNAYYEYETEEFDFAPNKFYNISLWVKTADIKSTTGIYVSLMGFDDNGKETSLSSFDKVNTTDDNELTNGWSELSFAVQGGSDEIKSAFIRITYGSGTRWTSDTLAKGAAFVTNMSMTDITYANFNNTSSSTTVKTYSFATKYSDNFSNGSFNEFDLEDTKGLNSDGQLSDNAGVPTNWTISDKKVLTTDSGDDNTDLVAGIIEMDTTNGFDYTAGTHITNLFGSTTGFDTLYDSADTLSVGGPRMLSISGLNSEKYAVGFESSNISLSANKVYEISFWAKTMEGAKASAYLAGESNGKTYFDENSYFEIAPNTNWTQYKFVVEVGLTSVSLRLNFWLGYDKDVIDVAGTTDEEKTENAKSTGIALFDSVSQKDNLTAKDFDKIENATANQRKISFLADGFDSLSDTVSSRKELSTPSGWSGSPDEEQSSKNSKSGVIYADDAYLELDDDYVKILGAAIDKDDIEISDSDLSERFASDKDLPIYDGLSEDEIKAEILEILIEEEYASLKADSWIPMSQLKAKSGNRMLVINNTADSAYIYSSSAKTMQSNSFYKVSVWAKTYGVDSAKGAYITLDLGSADEDDSPLHFETINTDTWTEYNFYVQTAEENVTSIKLKLALGRYIDSDTDTLASGYAMFDDVEFEKISAEEYTTVSESANLLKREVVDSGNSGSTGSDDEDEDEGTTTPDNKFNNEMLWWMIPSIVIALALIAVMITFFIKRFRKPKKSSIAPSTISENEEEKHSRYDSFEE